ncbi:MAG: hypothetical protein J5449_12825 [Oscillospiraceae bacterium]|nr:hypothetical protein [Oscillospiraceae bacterium]
MTGQTEEQAPPEVCTKKALSWETLIFLVLLVGAFGAIGAKMGVTNMLNTLMNTAYELLIGTVFYIMAIAVLAGALSALLTEFGVVSAINKLLSPLMKPVYGLPGASIVGVLATYLSDNPAILTLADDKNFLRYFKKYQVPALTNIGTAFGMGLIISTFMIGAGAVSGLNCFKAVLFGNLGAIIGSIVSTRLMLIFTARQFGKDVDAVEDRAGKTGGIGEDRRVVRSGNAASRFLAAALEGGQTGVDMGLAIIPGVLIICSVVMMLSKGPGAGGAYTGAAYEGIALLPWIGEKIEFILKPLFGFQSPEAIAVPITALGAAGAAIGLVPDMLREGTINTHDIAVFTAMCMCWSGYLSTHVAMMDSLHYRELTGKAIACHTLGGIAAGIAANLLCVFL